MPTLSIYVNDKIYQYLGKEPSKKGKEWIEERYKAEMGDKNEQQRGMCQMQDINKYIGNTSYGFQSCK